MNKNRLEAFSDGVLAIVITIMVLELKVPSKPLLSEFVQNSHIFLSYALSFVYIAIYWNNHHHIFQMIKGITWKIMWANMNLLFWLSLIPFSTAWVSDFFGESEPLIFYGLILLMSGISANLLIYIIKLSQPEYVKKKLKKDKNYKGIVSAIIYIIGILIANYNYWLALACFVTVAILWIIPNQKIEQKIINNGKNI